MVAMKGKWSFGQFQLSEAKALFQGITDYIDNECIWLIIIAYFGFVCRSGFWNADLFLFIFRIHISWSERLACAVKELSVH